MGSIFGFSRLQSPAFQGQRDTTIYVEHVPTVLPQLENSQVFKVFGVLRARSVSAAVE